MSTDDTEYERMKEVIAQGYEKGLSAASAVANAQPPFQAVGVLLRRWLDDELERERS